MKGGPPRTTRTDTLCPYTTLCRARPERGGRALVDLDQQRVGQPPRDVGILDPAVAQQFLAHFLEIDERYRARLLVERNRIDRHLVHPLEPGALDLLDADALAPPALGDRRADQARTGDARGRGGAVGFDSGCSCLLK